MGTIKEKKEALLAGYEDHHACGQEGGLLREGIASLEKEISRLKHTIAMQGHKANEAYNLFVTLNKSPEQKEKWDHAKVELNQSRELLANTEKELLLKRSQLHTLNTSVSTENRYRLESLREDYCQSIMDSLKCQLQIGGRDKDILIKMYAVWCHARDEKNGIGGTAYWPGILADCIPLPDSCDLEQVIDEVHEEYFAEILQS